MDQRATANTTIEQLYHNYHEPIMRYLTRLVTDRETAEDLCHDTFLKALRRWGQHDPARVKGWLYRIATNTAYDYLRHGRRVELTPLTDNHVTTFTAPAIETRLDDTEPILAALRCIPEHYRLPLLLYAHAGYDLQEIASTLGCNVTTIKTRVHRARMRFRQVYVA
jgi:RNA polymerase sigma-70 factor, ECF subfamily